MSASGSDHKNGSTSAKVTNMLSNGTATAGGSSLSNSISALVTGETTPGMLVPNNTPAASVADVKAAEDITTIAAREFLSRPSPGLKHSASAPQLSTLETSSVTVSVAAPVRRLK